MVAACSSGMKSSIDDRRSCDLQPAQGRAQEGEWLYEVQLKVMRLFCEGGIHRKLRGDLGAEDRRAYRLYKLPRNASTVENWAQTMRWYIDFLDQEASVSGRMVLSSERPASGYWKVRSEGLVI